MGDLNVILVLKGVKIMSVEHHELAEAYLRKLVEDGMHKRYDERCGGIPQEVIDRVEMEYQTIMGYTQFLQDTRQSKTIL